jgi:nucleoside-diphosphate-sugar epimerase
MTVRRVLVTGASGFVGSHVARALVAEGWDVHLVVRSSAGGRLGYLGSNVSVHCVDLADRVRLSHAVGTIEPSHIVHLAAATMRGGNAPTPDELFGTNFLGTVNLIDACAPFGYERFVNFGDAFEYGPGRGSAPEDRPCRPATYDGLAELAATTYAHDIAATEGRPIITLRCFSIYGPDDHPERLVPRLVGRALAGSPIPLSRPEVSRDFVAVDDLVRLVFAALAAPVTCDGQVFNAGSGVATTLETLVDAVVRLTGSACEVRWGEYPLAPHDLDHPHADLTKTRSQLDWRPSISLDDGLASLIRQVRDAA